jgi:hypothetical protein
VHLFHPDLTRGGALHFFAVLLLMLGVKKQPTKTASFKILHSRTISFYQRFLYGPGALVAGDLKL